MITDHRFALPTTKGLLFVKSNDIIYCTSEGSYTHVYLANNKKITIAKRLKEVYQKLPQETFLRVHRSHIINLNHVLEFTNGQTQVVTLSNGEEFNISKTKKAEFMERFIRL